MATTTLRILREVKGYKQEEIAEVLGISQNTYSRLERNPKSLTAEQVQKLAEFYEVSIIDLMSETVPTVIFHSSCPEKLNNKSINRTKTGYQSENDIASINLLKDEIAYLRRQNLDLIKALGNKQFI